MSLFPDLSDAFEGPQEIESLCMQCYKNGVTKLLLTKIPFFKEVIISSFKCEHCGFSNNEVQPGSAIQPKGVRYTVTINDKKMMNRQVVKQASAMFRIEELDFEGPAFTSQGALTTIEGLFENAIAGLQQQQQLRMIQDPDLAKKIDEVINKLNEYKTGDIPFTLIVEDISGNSFVENPYAPDADPFVKIEYFKRSKEHNEQLGLNQENEDAQDDEKEEFEVLEFQTNCSSCNGPAPTRMKQLDIPHFKQVIIMATTCDACGKKTNEVRAGGAIEELGTRITFRMTDPSDLNRDVLTSESCTVSFPHLEMEFRLSSSGGKFTTLEGLLYNVLEHLGTISPFSFGDSAAKTNKVNDLVETIHKVIEGKEFITIVLDDPVGNSYLQNIYAPDPDPEIKIEKYERTQDQNDQYGLSDMKTENYINS
ncbi:zinc finger protein ZPR1 isoform X1 [Hydra vulgaris]|nr:zinc finger protein ZPR1 [Hydra vulgaris]